MKYSEYRPKDGPLAGAVEVVFCIEQYDPNHQIERLVPTGRSHLVIELDGESRSIFDTDTSDRIQTCSGSWVSGIHSRHLTITAAVAESRLAVVQFYPGMAFPFLQKPMFKLNDCVLPAGDVFGVEMEVLRDGILQEESGQSVVRSLEEWLLKRFCKDMCPPDYIQTVMHRLLRDPAEIALTKMVKQDDVMSYKHFVALFSKYVGPSPKQMQRILRFAQVLNQATRSDDPNWSSISSDLGYADQSHCIRDFRAFSGLRPQEFMQLCQGRTNFIPDDRSCSVK